MAERADPDAWLWPGTRRRIARVLLDAEAPITGSDIALALGGTHASNVNRELVALEEAKLVTVQGPDPADAPTAGRPPRYWRLDPTQGRLAETAMTSSPTPQRPPRRARETVSTDEEREDQSQAGGPPASDSSRDAASSATAVARGHELVIADASGTGVVDLMDVLARSEKEIALSWVALCGDELLMAFSGPRGPESALDLIAGLSKGGVRRVRRATVSQTWSGPDFIALSQLGRT